MASAGVSFGDSFLSQIEKARAELRERVIRAYQVLKERETELLSELQRLENSYKGEGNLDSDLETAKVSRMRIQLEWDGKLEGILSKTGKIQIEERKIDSKPACGLWNLGNTCFMNCILQCLSHTLPLRQLYLTDMQCHTNKMDLSSAFSRIIEELWDTNLLHSVVDPSDLKKQVESMTSIFPGYEQHDAHEFMRFLLNELHEEISSVEGRKSPADNETLGEACARHLTWEDSRISELFGGMLRSEVCCSVCSDKSIVYIPFMDIALPIQETTEESYYHFFSSSDPAVQLDTCLKIFTAEETLDGEDCPYCNICNALTKSTKQLTIAKLPKLLVIQLRRFSGNQIRRKLTTPVLFDDKWKLVDDSNKTHTYSLYGIVCHTGSILGGHYTAYCKYRDIWRYFDDPITSIVSWEEVEMQEAYILFYKREEDIPCDC